MMQKVTEFPVNPDSLLAAGLAYRELTKQEKRMEREGDPFVFDSYRLVDPGEPVVEGIPHCIGISIDKKTGRRLTIFKYAELHSKKALETWKNLEAYFETLGTAKN